MVLLRDRPNHDCDVLKMGKKPKAKKSTLNGETLGFILIATGLLTFISLFSFRFLHPERNWLGYFGYLLSYGLEYSFGLAAFLIPLYLCWLGTKCFKAKKLPNMGTDHLYFLILLCSSSIVLTVMAEKFPGLALVFDHRIVSEMAVLKSPYPRTIVRFNLGGAPFYFLFIDLPYISLQKILSSTGTALIFSSLGIVAFLLLTRMRLLVLWKGFMQTVAWIRQSIQKRPSKKQSLKSISPTIEKKYAGLESPLPGPKPSPKKTAPPDAEPVKPDLVVNIAPPKKEVIPVPNKQLIVKSDSSYQVPPSSLLTSAVAKVDQPTLKKDLVRQSQILEETLRSFGIEAKVGEINSGPTITSFEVHPSIGVKVQKIKALENDIALNMQAKSIRIVAPIPGKAAVGVEVPALHPQEVNFKDLLIQYQTSRRKLQIPILVGKAVNGECVFTDLAKMPHCLIAGATGSGKSVCINTIVMSILLNARPDEIKLLMIDPKKVELTQYSRLPHMIAPVITEPHGAYAALQWLVKEMQIRYEILKQLGLRNITAFNSRKINKDLETSLSIPIPEQMPFIVAIVDEFADLMMVSSADLETPIARIAQMARAVGIHLLLATQRPSREVITGIIKANIPTRISFKVASRINSQIILDDTGAESLLGNGDLLFLPPGSSQLIRAQGAYISDEDINTVIKHICGQTPSHYLIPSFDAFKALPSELETAEPKGNDPLYDQALTLVLASKNASTTYLQRKLKIGYARAASLMDELETNGIISPQDGAKPRRVLGSSSQVDILEEGE